MSVELVYQDQFLSTGRTIELVTQEVSVSLESVDLGVSIDLSVSSPVVVELSMIESVISLDLAMTPIVSDIVLTNPQFTYSDGLLTRIDYDGAAYKIFTYESGLLERIDFFNGSEVTTKTLNRSNGVVTSITEESAQIVDLLGYTPEDASKKGVADGYAPLGADSKIPAVFLPSYVDDVQEFASRDTFPATGESGKIYITTDTNNVYRWSGSTYIQIVSSPGTTDAITEGANNLFHTLARVRAAISASGSLSYNPATGVFSFTLPTYAAVASSGSYADLLGKPTLFTGSYADLTGKPTTLSGYGITDAQATLVSGTNIKTINGTSVLGSGDIAIPAGSAGQTGPKGDTGDTGATGAKGDKGDTGERGLQGIQGVKGDTGLQGAQGETGPQGLQGIQGPKGDTGNAGAQGVKGDTGEQGIQGLKGDKGDTGDQGPIGLTGATGATGSQGIKGDTGDQGPQGNQGIQGLKGDTGDAGLQGLKGDKGDTGLQGVQGVKGDTGEQGIEGAQGLKGDTGEQGIQGLKGDTGDTGAQGIQGVKGDTGDQGPQGIQGVKGDTGDTGATGAKGDKGDTGDQGPQGIQGIQGEPGTGGSGGSAETTETIVEKLAAATTISDSSGKLRSVPPNNQEGSYTLVASDNGKTIITSSEISITIPYGVFAIGDVITIVNGNIGSTNVQILSSINLRIAGQVLIPSGNRTLQPLGVATILFIYNNFALISGPGLQ